MDSIKDYLKSNLRVCDYEVNEYLQETKQSDTDFDIKKFEAHRHKPVNLMKRAVEQAGVEIKDGLCLWTTYGLECEIELTQCVGADILSFNAAPYWLCNENLPECQPAFIAVHNEADLTELLDKYL